jgi:uncharacterized protein YeaO (DUF488 family)
VIGLEGERYPRQRPPSRAVRAPTVSPRTVSQDADRATATPSSDPHDDDAARLRHDAYLWEEFVAQYDAEVPQAARQALLAIAAPS